MNTIAGRIDRLVADFLLGLGCEHSDHPDIDLVVAFSGGPDSCALLKSLANLYSRKIVTGKLRAVYINHKLRSQVEISAEKDFVRNFCQETAVPLEMIDADDGQINKLAQHRDNGLEDAARMFRYRILEEARIRCNAQYIATAHNLDDQIETMIMRFFQGSGLDGLKGIPAINGAVIRPLMKCRKSEIIAYLEYYDINPSIDSTNLEHKFLRNRIRGLIPQILEVFPGSYKTIPICAEKLTIASDFIESSLSKEHAFSSLVHNELLSRGVLTFSKTHFIDLNPFLRLEFLYYCWQLMRSAIEQEKAVQGTSTENHILPEHLPYALIRDILFLSDNDIKKTIDSRNTNSIKTAMLDSRSATKRILEFEDTTLYTDNNSFFWVLHVVHTKKNKYLKLVTRQRTLLYDQTSMYVFRHAGKEVDDIVVDSTKVSEPLIVRSYVPGDNLALVDGSKMVKKLFKDWKIPADQRWKIPVVEDRRGIIAILGKPFGGKNRVAAGHSVNQVSGNGNYLYLHAE